MIGLRVGPFEIERKAHVPVDGDWFLAARTGTTRRRPTHVLIKLLAPDANQAARTELQREFDALRAAEDSRVPRAVGYYEGTGAMVLEAVGGVPIAAVIDARRSGALPMTPATLCDLGLDLSECLQHAHHKGQVHGHLAPEKLWLAQDGRLWVWGFGRPDQAPAVWLAPERARGLPVTAATDQWSLGALLAGLVMGTTPWASIEEAKRGSTDTQVGDIEVQWPALGRLLRRMLDPEPSRRFPDLGPVRQELLALSRKAGGLSERRELAISLASYAPEPPPPEPADSAPVPGLEPLPVAATPAPTLATEDDDTVRQPRPSAGPELAEAESREAPIGRLASPGALADEKIAVVRHDLTEDLPAAVIGGESPPQEFSMPQKNEDEPTKDKSAAESAEAEAPTPAEDQPAADEAAHVEAEAAVAVDVEYNDEDSYSEDADYDDDSEYDEEATQIVDSAAVQRAIAEARRAQGLDDHDESDATDTLPPDEDTGGHHVGPATGDPELNGAAPTNPTAVPWTDPGGEYGSAKKKPFETPMGEPEVVIPAGDLPKPIEPRPMPRNQQVALGFVALMVLMALLYVVLQM